MTKTLVIILFSACFLNFFVSSLQGDNVTSVEKLIVVFRHGARLPINKDTLHKADMVPLTNEGKLQSFNLGKMLRNRYPHLLNKKYDAEEIYMRSSDVDRCLMTSSGLLAGLYHPIDPMDKWIEQSDLQWTPIPVHTAPKELDEMLYSQRDLHCPAMQKLIKVIVDQIRVKYPVILENYENLIKSKVNTSNKLNNALMEYDYENMPGSLSKEKVQEFSKEGLTLYFGNPQWKRFDSGPFLNDVMNKLSSKRKMLLYGAHDNFIWGLLYALGLDKPIDVHFLSTILIELHVENSPTKDATPKKYIKILHRNGPDAELEVKHIPNCDELCPIEKFEAFVKPLLNDNWFKECE